MKPPMPHLQNSMASMQQNSESPQHSFKGSVPESDGSNNIFYENFTLEGIEKLRKQLQAVLVKKPDVALFSMEESFSKEQQALSLGEARRHQICQQESFSEE